MLLIYNLITSSSRNKVEVLIQRPEGSHFL